MRVRRVEWLRIHTSLKILYLENSPLFKFITIYYVF